MRNRSREDNFKLAHGHVNKTHLCGGYDLLTGQHLQAGRLVSHRSRAIKAATS